MDFEMIGGALLESGFGDAVLNVVRHGFGRHVEDSGLIHVVPEAGNTVVEKVLVERSPPLAGDLTSELGEDRWTGPYDAGVDSPVGILNEVVPSGTAVIRGVVGIR